MFTTAAETHDTPEASPVAHADDAQLLSQHAADGDGAGRTIICEISGSYSRDATAQNVPVPYDFGLAAGRSYLPRQIIASVVPSA